MKHIARPHSGFAAIAAIFLVVVLAALGAFMLTFSNTQQLSSAKDVQGSRAYWAARAGLEWGIGSVVASASSPAPCPVLPVPATPSSLPSASSTLLPLTLEGGFSVTVTCNRVDYIEGSASRSIFQFTAVAATGATGSIGFIERSLSASLER
jgi:MSHA biogenesis protein MshP